MDTLPSKNVQHKQQRGVNLSAERCLTIDKVVNKVYSKKIERPERDNKKYKIIKDEN